MKKITPKYRAFVQEKAPQFFEAIERARAGDRGAVEETLESFADDPFLLYAALWHAYSVGVSVLLAAPEQRSRR